MDYDSLKYACKHSVIFTQKSSWSAISASLWWILSHWSMHAYVLLFSLKSWVNQPSAPSTASSPSVALEIISALKIAQGANHSIDKYSVHRLEDKVYIFTYLRVTQSTPRRRNTIGLFCIYIHLYRFFGLLWTHITLHHSLFAEASSLTYIHDVIAFVGKAQSATRNDTPPHPPWF